MNLFSRIATIECSDSYRVHRCIGRLVRAPVHSNKTKCIRLNVDGLFMHPKPDFYSLIDLQLSETSPNDDSSAINRIK